MNMFMQVSPILAALRRHKTAVILLMLEVALTMAVFCNLVFIVSSYMQQAHTPTGVEGSRIGVIQSVGIIGSKRASDGVAANLRVLKQVPGVTEAAYGGPPLWGTQRVPVYLHAARQHPVTQAYSFSGSQGYAQTLGLHTARGHGFRANALPSVAQFFGGKDDAAVPVLVTRALAQKLFGSTDPLGKMIYTGRFTGRVIGVVKHLRGQITGSTHDDESLVAEFQVGAQQLGGGFMIRADSAAHLPRILRRAAAALQKANPGQLQANTFTFPEYRANYFRGEAATGRILIGIIVVLLVVTALGVTGLASFWVQRRRRQIGVRRALGATRRHITNYFRIENFLIVTGGVLLGAVLAYVLNLFLMQHFALPRLPADYVVVGAIALWILGQLAVLAPALCASHVSPVVATRSV